MPLSKGLRLLSCILFVSGCTGETTTPPDFSERIAAINKTHVFADMHAHPSRFHRVNVETILPDEFELYKRSHINLVVANISSDMAYRGGYINRDGSEVERGEINPAPGVAFELSLDRLRRLGRTVDVGYAVHAGVPADVIAARASNQIAIMPALEGADAFEGKIENFRQMYDEGLRLVQFIHFRHNELGYMQTEPYSDKGLTEFGRAVVEESNRLGVIIDMAHANHQTMMDILEISEDPVIFSHGGVREYTDHDRVVTDDEIRAIANGGGVVGIWPHGRHIETVSIMVDYIEHVIKVGGIDHVGIGSDLRGMSRFSIGFDDDAKFTAIAEELLERGYTDDAVGKVMGGNFFRVWETVSN